MRLASIDPAPRKSGVALWEGGTLVDVLTVRDALKRDKVDAPRVASGRGGLVTGAGDLAVWRALWASWKPDAVVLEGANPGGKGYKTAVQLEQYRGLVSMSAVEAGVAVDEVHALPNTIWRRILGLGRPASRTTAEATRQRKAQAKRLCLLMARSGRLPAWAGELKADGAEAVCIGLAFGRIAARAA